MSNPKGMPRDQVILFAFGDGDRTIEEARLTTEEYYDGSPELIDSNEYRRTKGIATIKGEIYDPKGKLGESFENRYDRDGVLLRSRITYDDGSVAEAVFER